MPQHALRDTRRLPIRRPSLQQLHQGEQLNGRGMHSALRAHVLGRGLRSVRPLDRHPQGAAARIFDLDVPAVAVSTLPPKLATHEKPLPRVRVHRQRDRDEARIA
jgi:hypothetical protein